MNLSADQKRALRRLWKGDLTIEEIAEDLTFSTYEWIVEGRKIETETFDAAAIEQAAAQMRLGKRPGLEVYVPTMDEIRLAAAQVRAGWTQREREDRLKNAWIVGTLEQTTEADNDARGSADGDRAAGDQVVPEARRRLRRGRGLEDRQKDQPD